ncbi:MAG: hypothetical protein WC983_07150 [Tissierellaceae bacterium]
MDPTSLTYDILKEMFNISVGKAAKILSEITSKKIKLDVPRIEFLDSKDKREVNNSFSNIPDGTLMLSSISFSQKLSGEANLIFPANKMKSFINLCLDEDSRDTGDTDFTDMDFDVIREVGNIILNSIVGEMGNFLDINLDYSLPEVKVFAKEDFKSDLASKEYFYMLMLYITFIICDTEIEGAIIINLKTRNSFEELMRILKKMEDDLDD